MSVAKASAAGGVSPATLKRWEAGASAPQPEAARRLFAIYGSGFVLTPEPDRAVLQRALRVHRRRAGLTLEEAAAASGLSVPSVHRYETGGRLARADDIERLGRALGMPIEERRALGDGVWGASLPGGLSPVLQALSELESLGRDPDAGPADALRVLRMLVIVGDQQTVRESWPQVFRPRFADRPDRATRALARSFAALVSARRGVAEPARLESVRREVAGLPPSSTQAECMLNLARRALAVGDLREAAEWNGQASEFASRRDDSAVMLHTRLIGLAAESAASPSASLADDVGRLAGEFEHPLPRFVATVAQAEVFFRMGEARKAAEVLERCQAEEERHGFGSPLAWTLRRKLGMGARLR